MGVEEARRAWPGEEPVGVEEKEEGSERNAEKLRDEQRPQRYSMTLRGWLQCPERVSKPAVIEPMTVKEDEKPRLGNHGQYSQLY